MNKKLGMIGSILNAFTVLSFAGFMLIGFNFGSYFSCIFLAISFVIMICALDSECVPEKKTAGKISVVFSGIYAVLIFIVYFTQCTTVTNEKLGHEAERILNFSYMGMIFNLDMLGYAMMALSTFFMGLALNIKTKADKILKLLLLIHGVFFISCFIMPMTGIFSNGNGSTSIGGIIALEIWCLYFLPIGILSFIHFKKNA